MIQDQYLGKYVAIRTAQGDLVDVGQCISYTDRPTIGVNTLDGKQVDWIADLCEVLPLKDDVVEALVLATSAVVVKADG